jgi:F-type H+-transporting ATPase subunit b
VEYFAKENIFVALGIDWKTMIIQIVAFLILVWAFSRWVYPWLMKSVDDRKAEIDAGAAAAEEAKQKADEAEKQLEKLLAEARSEASDIVSTAKDEAAAAIEAAEDKARQHADTIVENAKAEIEKDIAAAKSALYNEAIDLVASATEKVTSGALKGQVDEKIVAAAVKESR